MTIRLTCDVSDTKELLKNILVHTNDGSRVMFLCEAGAGGPAIQRVRVHLSRVRNNLKNRNKKRRYFLLRSTIHPHTEGGKRFDCVVVWQTQTDNQRMIESLEDLVGNGATL